MRALANPFAPDANAAMRTQTNATTIAGIAALLFLVAGGLIDRGEIARIWREAPGQRWPLLVTLIATITLSLEWAILLGITVALLAQRFARESYPECQTRA